MLVCAGGSTAAIIAATFWYGTMPGPRAAIVTGASARPGLASDVAINVLTSATTSATAQVTE